MSTALPIDDPRTLSDRFCAGSLSPAIQHAVCYIQQHYAEGMSIKEYCVQSKRSASYFGYLFRKETGMAFNGYLLQLRIESAIALLKSTDQRVYDIAAHCGFASASYFICSFKRCMGLPPAKYRALLTRQAPGCSTRTSDIGTS